jgi:hypothetical protein
MRWVLVLVVLPALVSAQPSRAKPAGHHHPGPNAAEIMREMNLARQHPDVYAAFIEKLRGRLHGNILVLPDGTMRCTREGIGAVDEAIAFLRRTPPLGLLTLSPGISMAAEEHVADQASGIFGHSGSDRSDPGERMNRHGAWSTLGVKTFPMANPPCET